MKERERRILQLTIAEITSLEEDVNVYRGVGKMCVACFFSRSYALSIAPLQVHDGTPASHGKGPERGRKELNG